MEKNLDKIKIEILLTYLDTKFDGVDFTTKVARFNPNNIKYFLGTTMIMTVWKRPIESNFKAYLNQDFILSLCEWIPNVPSKRRVFWDWLLLNFDVNLPKGCEIDARLNR